MGIYLTNAELEVLDRAEGVLVKGYLWLRSRMDLRTRIVGRKTGISHVAVAEHCEYEIRKGAGVQVVRLGKDMRAVKEAGRRVLERLEGLGLLIKQGGALLCFLCPLADDAQARPNQTGHLRDTPVSTDQDTRKSSASSGIYSDFDRFRSEQDTPSGYDELPNGTHIKDQGVYTHQSSSTDSIGVAPGDADAAGVNRDRPAASQAGSLGRPGDTQEDPDRDRPTGSHPAPGRRLVGPAQQLGALLHPGSSEALEGLAANESTPVEGASPEADALLSVLQRRGINARNAWAELRQWAADGVTPDVLAEAVERALAARSKAGSVQPINVAYVGTILRNDRKQAARTAGRIGDGLSSGTSGLDAMARQLGIALARPGETHDQYRARVSQAWSGRKQGGAGNGTA